MSRTVVGVFRDRDKASEAARALINEGFAQTNLSLVSSDEKGDYHQYMNDGTKLEQGALAGAGTGLALGGLVGLFAGLGGILIPGVGVVAGPLIGAITGAALGAAGGGLVGALIGLGIPEQDARIYDKAVVSGNVMVVVHTDEQYVTHAERVLNMFEPIDISESMEPGRVAGAPPVVPGQVSRVRSYTTTQPVVSSNPPRQEVVNTTAVPVVTTDRVVDDVVVTSPVSQNVEPVDDFRQDWEIRYKSHNRSFDDCRPAYSFGHRMGYDPRFQSREWHEIENQIRAEWERDHTGYWSDYRDAIRTSWERSRAHANRARML